MIAFFITLFLGFAEMLLLNAVLKYALASEMKKMIIFILLKLALYGAVVTLIMLTMKSSIVMAAIGFSLGLPGAAIVTTLININRGKKAALKGDERIGHSENN